MSVRVLPLREVMQKTSLGKTKIYLLMKADEFPRPVRLGGRVAWVESEIDGYLERLIAEREPVS